MPKKSISKKSLSFGRKKRSKSNSTLKHVPMEVSIKIYFKDPFKSSSKAKWVTLPGLEEDKLRIGKMWYSRLIMERLIKLVVIQGMQTCIRVCYRGQIPKWFNRQLPLHVGDKDLEDYWGKAKRVVACMRLFSPQDAGFLLKDRSVFTAKNSNQLEFRTPEDLASECRYRDDMYNSIWDMLGLAESSIDDNPNVQVSKDSAFNESKLHCSEIVQYMKKAIHTILSGNLSNLGLQGLDGVLIDYSNMLKVLYDYWQHVANRKSGKKVEQVIPKTHTQPVTPVSVSGNTKIPSQRKTPASNNTFNDPSDPAMGGGGDIRSDVLTDSNKRKSITSSDLDKASGDTQNVIDETKNFLGGGGRFGRRRRSRFGMTSIANMVGYTDPYRISEMESYTGMTPEGYRRHINSRTGQPVATRFGNLARQNDYYGSYRLGEMLNPLSEFGRKRRRVVVGDDEQEKKPKRRTLRKRVTKKCKTKSKSKSKKCAYGRKRVTKKCKSKSKTKKCAYGRKRVTKKCKSKSAFGRFFF